MKYQSGTLVFVLAALAALAPFAIDTYLPAFFAIEKSLSTNTINIQQSLTVYLVPYALMTLWHGAISDSIGRINTIKIGLGVFVVASIGCAMATNVETLWFFRALQGASGGAGNTVARAMVRDLFEGAKAQKVMATVQMLFGIAPAIAPIIGGFLLGIHWQAIFIFLALYAALSLWAAVVYLPETMPPEKRLKLSVRNVLASYRTIFSDGEFAKLCVAVAANFSAFFIYVLSAPVFLGKHLNLQAAQYGYFFLSTVAGMMFGSFLARRVAGKMASGRIVRWAYFWMTAMAVTNIAVCYGLSVEVRHNIWPIALFNIGMALCMPVLSIAALDRHPKIRGTAASGQAFMQMLLSAISAGIIVPLLWFSPIGLAWGMLGFLLLGVASVSQTAVWRQ